MVAQNRKLFLLNNYLSKNVVGIHNFYYFQKFQCLIYVSALESEKKENARLAVYWLIKASEQGNTEATSLLQTCLQTGKGITEHNYMDVKSCISMTQDEKLARRAAKEMFVR